MVRSTPKVSLKSWRRRGFEASAILATIGLAAGLLGCEDAPGSGLPVGSGSSPGLGSGGGAAVGGSVGSGSATGSGGTGTPVSTTLTARTWRLSHEQYRRSVLALVGKEPDLSNFQPESGNGRYQNFSSTALVQVDLAANYYDVAKVLAQELTTAELAALTSCTLDVSCRDAFISELGQKAFRMPVPAEVQARLAAIYDLAAAGDGGAEDGYRAVLVAVLNSPLFLYRKETGPEADVTSPEVSLTSHQVAELLSFSVLGSPPPVWLSDLASTGALGEAELAGVIAQLIQEPGFQEQLGQFLSEWLEVGHFETVEKSEAFPGFAEAKPLIEQELALFFGQSGQATTGLSNLLLDLVPTVSPALDAFYFSDPSAPSAAERVGVLGLGAVLASHAKSYLTSPTLRGTFVRGRFFCQDITLPEGFTPPPLSETEALGIATTTRDLYERHQSDPSCSICHRLTDNIGFSLEAYDGAGRFRTLDATQGPPVALNTTTELTDSDVNRPLSSARDLSQALSESAQVKACFARQAFRFYLGQLEPSPSALAVQRAQEMLLAQDTLQQLVTGLLSTSMTTLRTREAGD